MMAVHMVSLRTPRNATLRHWATVWITNMTAWHAADNQPPTNRETADGTPHMAADWRFAWGDNSKATLLGNLIGYARPYADWGVVGYHECKHDSDDPAPCPGFDYGLDGGFGTSIQSGVWGDPPATVDPRSDST